ncbi:NUDIX hydrolase [Actinoplanes sp. NEAU-A12]|uniref:NUDIX hydrolase n=1 Tax=Actinoplanes sandaracinus TaxID=3045177 RepID=A0ABT6WEM7_9ACTN|nr:NUDIX hydrolase [Actinoplanes sandaracinus]MDI6098186.1 NUDIX hydrolase [Actinoplanes sandaracinus]
MTIKPLYRSAADWPSVPNTVTKRCDNTSVGVLITNREGQHLLFARNTPPVGIAPAAGHVDEHGSPEQAARTEVAEELGLTVTTLIPLAQQWRTNICRRQHGPHGPGHHWTVYRAEVTGTITASPREARNPRWYTTTELQYLAERTADRARGRISVAEFAANPGLEPVWVGFLYHAGLITLSLRDLDRVDYLASQSPYESEAKTPYRYLIVFRCDNGANGMDVVPIITKSDVEFHTKEDLAPVVTGLERDSGYQNVRILSFELFPEESDSTDQ